MKRVIEIDEKDFKFLKESDGCRWSRTIIEGVINSEPLNEVLDKISAEIDAESAKSFKYPNWERAKALEWALSIIDKYEESED